MERLKIGLFGRTNVGKSTILNLILGQKISIVSEFKGTTTDTVIKTMELGSLGATTLLDTAGMDDKSDLGSKRMYGAFEKIKEIDYGIIITSENTWNDTEEKIVEKFREFNVNFCIIVNKVDKFKPNSEYIKLLKKLGVDILFVSAITDNRIIFLKKIIKTIEKKITTRQSNTKILDGLIKTKDIIIFVTPIDANAPKDRIILPQVQSLRAALDKNAISIFVQVNEYQQILEQLKEKPKLVVSDSQVIKEIIELSPREQLITTFSILLARLKGELSTEIKGVYQLEYIKKTDKILIAEACSHHQQGNDDIANVLLPYLLEKYLKFKPNIEWTNGRDYPENISAYKIIIHCGACMLTATEKQNRIKLSKNKNIAITNFGIVLSFLNGYIERVLEPFKE